MKSPVRIKIKGEDSTYIMESVAKNKKGSKVKYKDNVYVKEVLPSEYVMFEGVAYKRTMSLDEYNKKVLTESANKKAPKKIKLKGTNIVLDAIDESNVNSDPSNIGSKLISNDAFTLQQAQKANSAISGAGFYLGREEDPRRQSYNIAVKAVDDFLTAVEEYNKQKGNNDVSGNA